MIDRSHLPTLVPVHLQEKFTGICRIFELAWHDDGVEKPRIADFAKFVDAGVDRDRLIDILIAIEIRLRLATGESVDADEYRTQFPQHASGVDFAIEIAETENSIDSMNSVPGGKVSAVPERIGRYEVRETIGMGGFGVVCLAHDDQLNRLVALKFARKSRFESGQELETFVQEAQTAAQLDHVGIVTVYDVLQQDDLICIVQKYIDGRDLKSELTLQHPSCVRTTLVIRDVAGAFGVCSPKRIRPPRRQTSQHFDGCCRSTACC